MPSKKTVELRPSKSKSNRTLSFLKTLLFFVGLLNKLFYGINKLWGWIVKMADYLGF